jgi:hypothetical protein
VQAGNLGVYSSRANRVTDRAGTVVWLRATGAPRGRTRRFQPAAVLEQRTTIKTRTKTTRPLCTACEADRHRCLHTIEATSIRRVGHLWGTRKIFTGRLSGLEPQNRDSLIELKRLVKEGSMREVGSACGSYSYARKGRLKAI